MSQNELRSGSHPCASNSPASTSLAQLPWQKPAAAAPATDYLESESVYCISDEAPHISNSNSSPSSAQGLENPLLNSMQYELRSWVPKQPQLLLEAKPAAALPQPLVGKGDPQGTFEKRQQSMFHERSFWKAWAHVAMWREQEVDALKEGKAKVLQSRHSMTIVFRSWKITTAESRRRLIYCECCEMCLNGAAAWEKHKNGKKHTRKSRGPPYAETFSTAS